MTNAPPICLQGLSLMCAAFDPSPWVLPASVLNALIQAIMDVVQGESNAMVVSPTSLHHAAACPAMTVSLGLPCSNLTVASVLQAFCACQRCYPADVFPAAL